MKFVDLFAGLGGFHLALSNLGHRCVLACEIDPKLGELYEKNFGIRPERDIRKLGVDDVPSHDILCAGFPCQPFSKAGAQPGVDCPENGDLFEEHVLRLLARHKPKFIIFENVPNLERHRAGTTWAIFRKKLERLGYTLDAKVLSPHQFGVPQIRERLFIVGRLGGLEGFAWPNPQRHADLSVRSVLDHKPAEAKKLPEQVLQTLRAWQDFLERSPREIELPSFPIWSMEFGANYPFKEKTPFSLTSRALAYYRGSHGLRLATVSATERMNRLPSYARVKTLQFPKWKVDFIRQNRTFYEDNKSWVRPWIRSILPFPPSLQKLEWNCKGEKRDIWKYVIQFRASGVRIKRPTTAPSLVAMTSTQVPIIGWERRYMTPRECARLQSLDALEFLPTGVAAHEALGNAVNAHVVEVIAEALLRASRNSRQTASHIRLAA